MIIMESAIAMNNDYIECSNDLGKIGLFAEAAYKEYEINLKEVALKVLKENGTEDDFDFLATEAANGYIERAKKAIAKIVEAVKKFIHNCKENLLKLVTNNKTNVAIDKAEEACKANSKLRSMKVEYQDTDKQVGIIQQGIDRLCKKVSKIRAKGVATQNDVDDADKIESDTMKKVEAIAVVSTVTLGTAIALFKHCNSRSEVDATLNEDTASDCDISIDDNSAKNAETAAFLTKIAGKIAKLKKEKAAKKVVKSTSLLAAIKKVFSKAKGKLESENLEEQAHESTALEELTMFAYVVEATADEEKESSDKTEEDESAGTVEGLDIDEYFEELCEDIFTDKPESKEEKSEDKETEEEPVEESVEASVEESAETGETEEISALTYMEQLEREVFGEDEEVVEESTESEETDDDSDGSNALTYMEQLEREVFGEDEEVVEESTESVETTETDNTEITIESLLDEMEALL